MTTFYALESWYPNETGVPSSLQIIVPKLQQTDLQISLQLQLQCLYRYPSYTCHVTICVAVLETCIHQHPATSKRHAQHVA